MSFVTSAAGDVDAAAVVVVVIADAVVVAVAVVVAAAVVVVVVVVVVVTAGVGLLFTSMFGGFVGLLLKSTGVAAVRGEVTSDSDGFFLKRFLKPAAILQE